jgi:hypothetical protein
MQTSKILDCAKEAGALEEYRHLAGKNYWLFTCPEDLKAFADLVTAADRQALLDTLEALTGNEEDRHPMFSEGYDLALWHIEQFVRARSEQQQGN